MHPERIPHSPENAPQPAESLEHRRGLEQAAERKQRAGERLAAEQAEQAESAREQIEQLPDRAETSGQAKAHSHRYSPYQRSHAKQTSYQQTLKHLQNQLPSNQSRLFSRLIHQRSVETVSEVAAKTVFRPSVTLGASMGALVGGSLIYFLARHYGFELSGTEFLLFGIIGAAGGLALELLSSLLKRVLKRPS